MWLQSYQLDRSCIKVSLSDVFKLNWSLAAIGGAFITQMCHFPQSYICAKWAFTYPWIQLSLLCMRKINYSLVGGTHTRVHSHRECMEWMNMSLQIMWDLRSFFPHMFSASIEVCYPLACMLSEGYGTCFVCMCLCFLTLHAMRQQIAIQADFCCNDLTLKRTIFVNLLRSKVRVWKPI